MPKAPMLKVEKRNLPWLLLTVVVIWLDLWTKSLASANLDYGVPVEILPVFNLTLQHNTGAAFSFLSEAGGWQRWFFTVLALAISIGLVIWLFLAERGQWLLALSLALILGGAIGNVWDRIVLGYVVDFISVHHSGWYFPAFNIADAAITVGAGCMLLDSFLTGKAKQ